MVTIILIVLVLGRVLQVVKTPNLLLNSDFGENELTEWQVKGSENSQARAKLSNQGADNIVLKLDIPASPEGVWIGISQDILVKPSQRYKVLINYRLVSNAQSSSEIYLRVAQFGQYGQILEANEVPLSEPVINNPQEVNWTVFAYHFVANERGAFSANIGLGLYGQQAATVEVDNIVVKRDLTLNEAVAQDPVIRGLFLLWLVGTAYKSRYFFARLVSGVVQGTKARQRLVAMVGVNVILFVVLAELFALGFYFIRNGTLFYFNKPTYKLIEVSEATQALTPKRIHPYFGYVDKPGWQRAEDNFWKDVEPDLRTINNHGLGSDYDYPFIKRNENQYIIGVFGGSVAERFALLTRDRLIENLQQNDFFAKQEIIVLNFAKGGYKQPQQLLLLTYFLSIGQEFDLVINIDGFNEVAFSHRNKQRQVDLSMPHINILDGLVTLIDQTSLTPEKLESLAKINAYKIRLNTLVEKINNSDLAASTFILEQYYTIVFNNYQQELIKFDEFDSSFSENSLFFIKPDDQVLEDPILFGQIAANWANSSTMMSRTLTEEKIAYFHFLQPNQYYSNKTFSPEEAAIALEQGQPYYSTLVTVGYPYLIENFEVLKGHDVNFYNGIPIFNQESGMVYIDNCCHYNQLGNDILADFIATSILELGDFTIQ